MSPRRLLRRFRSHPVGDVAVTLLIVVAALWVIQAVVVKNYRIPSPSMKPTLGVGDKIFAVRFLYHLADPARGDIIVFHPNGSGKGVFKTNRASSEVYVKRLIGLPGEVVGSHGGRVWVCGDDREPVDLQRPDQTPGCRYLVEPYTHGKATTACPPSTLDLDPVHVGSGRYLMLGDNRLQSSDGRCWGTIRASQIIGRAFLTYWPLGRFALY